VKLAGFLVRMRVFTGPTPAGRRTRPSGRVHSRNDHRAQVLSRGRLRQGHQALVVDEFAVMIRVTGPKALLERPNTIIVHGVLLRLSKCRDKTCAR
jgi:hypothetical protein